MSKDAKLIKDYITSERIPLVGCEANRQRVEQLLVENKGYDKSDIEVGVPISLKIGEEDYHSRVDLVVTVNGKRMMLIKCAAGSLGSWERETISSARLLCSYQIPISIVSDGKTAVVLDTITGKNIGIGWQAVPSKAELKNCLKNTVFNPIPTDRVAREKLIFRSYDSMNVNRSF